MSRVVRRFVCNRCKKPCTDNIRIDGFTFGSECAKEVVKLQKLRAAHLSIADKVCSMNKCSNCLFKTCNLKAYLSGGFFSQNMFDDEAT